MLMALALFCAGATATMAAPQFAAMDGTRWITPGGFGGRPATVLFWSPDCPPCRTELSRLSKLMAADPEGVIVLAAIGRKTDARRVLDAYSLPAAVQNAQAPKAPRGLLARLGNHSGALPFTVRFDGKGRACASLAGPLTEEALLKMRNTCIQMQHQP